jgi:hypothetical protein
MAQSLDASKVQTTGEAVPIVVQVDAARRPRAVAQTRPLAWPPAFARCFR